MYGRTAARNGFRRPFRPVFPAVCKGKAKAFANH